VSPLPEDRVESPVKKKKPARKSTKTPAKPAPSKKPAQKQVAIEQVSKLVKESDEPRKKKVRKNIILAKRYEHFLRTCIVRGKVVKVSYFQE